MDFSGKLFLAVIEEDNIQRALFRVRPLLCEDGNLTPENIDELIDEGFLRVVPDKAEQHTFKERMRQLGQICLINLKNISPDFSKVRPNKNYAPNRGENNRFVIYSDAIQELGDIDIFEVVSDPKLIKPTTVCYYLRNGGHIQGPYDTFSSQALHEVSCIAPDHHRLFSVAMPDDREKLYYWPLHKTGEPNKKEEKNLAIEMDTALDQKEAESLPLSNEDTEEINSDFSSPPEALQNKQAIASSEYEISNDKKTIGMPIKNAAQKLSSSRSERLTLHAIIDRAVRHGRPEEPSVSIQNTSALQSVENPEEQYRQALHQLWNHPETRQQAQNYFMEMPGAAKALSEKIDAGGQVALHTIMHQQLNQLEAERLALMMEIENIKEKRSDLLSIALREGGARADELQKRQDASAAELQKISLQCEELAKVRKSLMEQSNQTLNTAHYAAAAFGVDCSFEKASKLIAEAMTKTGFLISKNDAINLLLIILMFPSLNITADYPADAELALTIISNAIGATRIDDHPDKETIILPGGDAPLFMTGNHKTNEYLFLKKHDTRTRVIATGKEEMFWPTVYLPITAGFSKKQSSHTGVAIKTYSLQQYLQDVSRDIPQDAMKILDQAEMLLQNILPIELKLAIITYLKSAQSLLEGGISTAIDYAFACFLIPFSLENGMNIASLRDLCEAMPKASRLL